MNKYLKNIVILVLLINSFDLFSQDVEFYFINKELFELDEKWKLIGKIESSSQYVFENKKDKLNLLISVRNPKYFEFYEKDLSSEELLERFYKWEFDYWNEPNELKSETFEIQRSEDKKYILWKLICTLDNGSTRKENFYLYTISNGKLIAINISSPRIENNDKFTQKEAFEYLQKIYSKMNNILKN